MECCSWSWTWPCCKHVHQLINAYLTIFVCTGTISSDKETTRNCCSCHKSNLCSLQTQSLTGLPWYSILTWFCSKPTHRSSGWKEQNITEPMMAMTGTDRTAAAGDPTAVTLEEDTTSISSTADSTTGRALSTLPRWATEEDPVEKPVKPKKKLKSVLTRMEGESMGMGHQHQSTSREDWKIEKKKI